jgi:hypothetical protein
MKWFKWFLILTIGGCDPMAVTVPDTNTFNLQNVVDAVEDHAGGITDTLQDSFNNAESLYFDPVYNNSDYAVADSMKRFRNYGPDNQNKKIFVPEGFSPNGDGIHDYFEVQNLEYYPLHRMSIFAPSAGCSCGGNGFSGGDLIYRRTNDYDDYPWDGKYNGADCPEISYPWVLEIDGETYDTGYVLISR